LAYDGYIRNLPAFLAATITRKRVACKTMWHGLKLPSDKLLPFRFPDLIVAPNTVLKPDEKDAFQNDLNHPAERVKGRMGEVYLLRQVTPQVIRSLPFAQINQNVPTPPDATSILGMNSFFMCLRVLTTLLATHSYSAFQTDDANSPEKLDEDVDIFFSGQGFLPIHDRMRGEDSATYAKRKEWLSSEDLPISHIEEDWEKQGMYNQFGGNGSVLVAKPAPFYPEINYGPPSSLPNLGGYVFPYFRNIIEPSFDTIIRVMARYFIGCMGDNQEEATNNWYHFRRGVDKWYKTDVGMEIAHIFFILQIALESQSRLFLIMNGKEYLGCALLGYKFVIVHLGSVYEPGSAKEVRKLALGLDKHTAALEKIITVIRTLTLDSGEMEVEGMFDYRNTRSLFTGLCSMKEKFEGKNLETVRQNLEHLTFREDFWPFTVHHIEKALRYLSNDDAIPADWPMYINDITVTDTSRANKVWSAFGPTAPSFLDIGGKEIKIAMKQTEKEKVVVNGQEIEVSTYPKPSVDFISVSGKKLHVALVDWANVVKNSRIKMNTEERAAGYRTFKFKTSARDIIWNGLRDVFIYAHPEDKGKKRAAEDSGEDNGKKVKKAKTKDNALSLDASFF